MSKSVGGFIDNQGRIQVREGEVGEVILVADEATVVDYLRLGSTANAWVGQTITIDGLAVGEIDVPSRLAGRTSDVLVFGKLFE